MDECLFCEAEGLLYEGDERCERCERWVKDVDCPESQKPCGHHCNHAMSHDACCWCQATWGESTTQLEVSSD